MRIYEELFIAKPDAPDEEVDAFIEQMKTTVSNAGATVDEPGLGGPGGRRRLGACPTHS